MEEEEIKKLVDLAMIFYQGAECPDANEWDTLFTALVERNEEVLRRLLKENSLEA